MCHQNGHFPKQTDNEKLSVKSFPAGILEIKPSQGIKNMGWQKRVTERKFDIYLQ